MGIKDVPMNDRVLTLREFFQPNNKGLFRSTWPGTRRGHLHTRNTVYKKLVKLTAIKQLEQKTQCFLKHSLAILFFSTKTKLNGHLFTLHIPHP